MGGKSSSNSRQETANTQQSIVNDGDYAGASDFIVDESDRSTNIDDSFNTTYEYRDESDNSFNYEDRSDNSVRIDSEVDNSYTDNREIDNSYTDSREIDNSITDNREIDNSYTDESDNSVNDSYNTTLTNSGDFAGVQGNVSVLDGGAIEESYNFAQRANEQAGETSRAAINAIGDNAYMVTETATGAMSDVAIQSIEAARQGAESAQSFSLDTLKESLGFGRDGMTLMQQQSSDYAANLTASANSFADTLEEITGAAISNANTASQNNLAAVASLAESTTTGGASNVTEAATTQIKYLSIAVAAALAVAAMR